MRLSFIILSKELSSCFILGFHYQLSFASFSYRWWPWVKAFQLSDVVNHCEWLIYVINPFREIKNSKTCVSKSNFGPTYFARIQFLDEGLRPRSRWHFFSCHYSIINMQEIISVTNVLIWMWGTQIQIKSGFSVRNIPTGFSIDIYDTFLFTSVVRILLSSGDLNRESSVYSVFAMKLILSMMVSILLYHDTFGEERFVLQIRTS